MKGTFRLARYYFIAGIREKNMSFWVMFYPMLLLLFMYLGLSNLKAGSEDFLKLGIAKSNPSVLILEQIDAVKLDFMSEEDAKQALEDKKIHAYILDDNNVLVTKQDLFQDVAKDIMNQLEQYKKLGLKNAALLKLKGPLYEQENKVENQLSVYFYSTVALFTIYGYFASWVYVSLFQANQSTLAQRNCIAPVSKAKGVAAGFLASLLVITISMVMLFTLTEAVLKLGLIKNWPASALLTFGAMIFGICWGMAFGAFNLPEWSKTIIGIAGSIFMALISGMMSADLRNFITLHAPWIHRLNPVSLIAEGYYRINVLGNPEYGLRSLITLGIYSLLFFAAAVFALRRNSYKEL